MARTQTQLEEASAALYYEYDMLYRTAHALETPMADGVIKNALIESFLIHARLIAQFFWQPATGTPNPNDVLPTEFVANWKSTAKSKVLIDEVPKINWYLAHLSYRRLHDPGWEWSFLKIADDLMNEVERFIAAVPQQLLAPTWVKFRSTARGPRFRGTDRSATGATGAVGPQG